MKRILFFLMTGTLVALGTSTAFANGHHADSTCSIASNPASLGAIYVVSAAGIPTRTAINLWTTTPDGAVTGSPLGSTPDGSFNLDESSDSAGVWTYSFSGPVKARTVVYATCSVDVY